VLKPIGIITITDITTMILVIFNLKTHKENLFTLAIMFKLKLEVLTKMIFNQANTGELTGHREQLMTQLMMIKL